MRANASRSLCRFTSGHGKDVARYVGHEHNTTWSSETLSTGAIIHFDIFLALNTHCVLKHAESTYYVSSALVVVVKTQKCATEYCGLR